MNRKQRRAQLQKIAQENNVDHIVQREVDAMEASDVNNADGESPEQFADRIVLEIMNSLPMPGIDDPV
jgi:hypothetical protein